MTDTERLDAINQHGLCLVQYQTLTDGEWQVTWACHYNDRVVLATTIREAIDMAVLDLSIIEAKLH